MEEGENLALIKVKIKKKKQLNSQTPPLLWRLMGRLDFVDACRCSMDFVLCTDFDNFS
jgi:hypothetical protein